MLKVGAIYVSPIEVEGALCTHPDVLEAAVVGWQDEDKLIKPKAIVVLKSAEIADEELARGLKEHVKIALAPYKYPRWIEFRKELPKTTNGKIQRFKLRGERRPTVSSRMRALIALLRALESPAREGAFWYCGIQPAMDELWIWAGSIWTGKRSERNVMWTIRAEREKRLVC
jgi:hypothetical protein